MAILDHGTFFESKLHIYDYEYTKKNGINLLYVDSYNRSWETIQYIHGPRLMPNSKCQWMNV